MVDLDCTGLDFTDLVVLTPLKKILTAQTAHHDMHYKHFGDSPVGLDFMGLGLDLDFTGVVGSDSLEVVV